jgi:hypothetical protein
MGAPRRRPNPRVRSHSVLTWRSWEISGVGWLGVESLQQTESDRVLECLGNAAYCEKRAALATDPAEKRNATQASMARLVPYSK